MRTLSKFLSAVLLGALSLATAGSGAANAGISFGSPVPARAALSSQTNILTWSVHVQKLRLFACNGGGSYTDHTVNATIDAAHGITLPAGCWEAMTVYFDSDFLLTAHNPNNYDVSLTLDVDTATMVMDGGDVDVVSSGATQTAIFEFLALDWYQDELEPYVNNNAAVTVTSNHSRHSALVYNLANYSTVLLVPIP